MNKMARPTKKIDIPIDTDVPCILTQLKQNKTPEEIGERFGVSKDTILRKIREHKKGL